jgi:hypothetical protein
MKLFVVVCLAVAVMAESDPNLVLTNGIFPTVYNTHLVQPAVVNPLVKVMKEEEKVEKVDEEKTEQVVYSSLYPTRYIAPTTYMTPTTYVNPLLQPVVVGPRYVSKNGEVEHIVAKREADPVWTYSNWAHPVVHNNLAVPSVYAANKAIFINPWTGSVTGKVANDAILPNNYASKGQYIARAPGSNTVHIAKREADPLTVYSSGILPSMVRPSVLTSVVRPSVYSTNIVRPSIYSTNLVRPIVYNTPVAAPTGVEGVVNGKTVADDAWQFTPGYAGKGTYVAKTPGSEHRAKREADPALLYRTMGYPYATIYNTPLRTTLASPYVSSIYNYPNRYYL